MLVPNVGKRKGTPKTPGSGRKKGQPNKRSAKAILRVKMAGLDPLDYMLSVMRNVECDQKERLAAAAQAAPYVHAKLSSVEMKAQVTTLTLAEEIAQLNALADSDCD